MHHNVGRISKQFKKTFSEHGFNVLGKAVRFCVRERTATPFGLAMGVQIFEFLDGPGQVLTVPVLLMKDEQGAVHSGDWPALARG
jgi:hypothetical protein